MIYDLWYWFLKMFKTVFSLPCYRTEAEDVSQWRCEFRGQIRAVRQWLNTMEKILPTLDPRVSHVYGAYGFFPLFLFHHTSNCQRSCLNYCVQSFDICFISFLTYPVSWRAYIHFFIILLSSGFQSWWLFNFNDKEICKSQ